LPDQQNQLLLSVNFTIFDTSTSDKIQSAKLNKLASKQKLLYLKQHEENRFTLAKQKLKIQKSKILSVKSAVYMGNSVYDIAQTKYENGIIDNTAYLYALSQKIYYMALYQQALNNFEIAKAEYFFASGVEYRSILDTL
jgi:outer membrane protein TolC